MWQKYNLSDSIKYLIKIFGVTAKMKFYKFIYFCFVVFAAIPSFAQNASPTAKLMKIKPASTRNICCATSINDSSKIILNPGNCPIEILRRLGRALGKMEFFNQWSESKTFLKLGTVLIKEFAGTPNFTRLISYEHLSETQKKECDNLLTSHEDDFSRLLNEFSIASEAILIKSAVNVKEVKDTVCKFPTDKILTILDSNKNNGEDLPFIGVFDDCYSVLSISEKGIFGRLEADSEKGLLGEIVTDDKISISEFIDDEPLILVAQTHSKKEASEVMKKLEGIENELRFAVNIRQLEARIRELEAENEALRLKLNEKEEGKNYV